MPKTGTTTLQHMFQGEHGPGSAFFGPHGPGVPLGKTLYGLTQKLPQMDLTERTKANWEARMGTRFGDRMPRQDALRKLKKLMDTYPENLVLSHESACGWYIQNPMAALAKEQCRTLNVLAYIRPVLSASISIFQQGLRNPADLLGRIARSEQKKPLLKIFAPKYQRSLAKWCDQSGFSFIVRPYIRPTAARPNALVQDFGGQIGMNPLRATRNLNEQHSAESISVRYGLFHDMMQTQLDPRLYNIAQRLCSSFGDSRLGLTEVAAEKLISDSASDIDWAKERFGLDMSETYRKRDVEIASLQELSAHGRALQNDLGDHLRDRWGVKPEFNGNWVSYFRNAVQKLQDDEGNLIAVPTDFNALDYLAANPDVAASGVDPEQHFRIHGFKEGRPLRRVF